MGTRRKRLRIAAAIATVSLIGGGVALATPGTGTSTLAARASFAGDVKVLQNHAADVMIAENVFMPGQHSGWHAHPGTTVIDVKSGSIAVYTLQPNGRCVRNMYSSGQGFVEEAGVYQFGKNESATETADLWVTFFNVPTGVSVSPNRIDLPADQVPTDPSCPAS